MKLFLSSGGVSEELKPHFLELVGKDVKDIKLVHIPNAADPYTEKEWLYETRDQLKGLGLQLTDLDLQNYKGKSDELKKELSEYDVIWVAGGNCYYLRWIFRETGFDHIIRQLTDQGIVYGGGSAGAIIMGPSLEAVDIIDAPDEAPEVISEGLGLVDFVPLPHWESEEYGEGCKKIKDHFVSKGMKVIEITDDQAILVNGSNWKIIP